MRNVLICGVPRSGTTLACHLLGKLPDVVALHEPISQWGNPSDQEDVCDHIDRFVANSRHSLLRDGTAASKHVDGKIPDNPKGSPKMATAWLSKLINRNKSALRKGLDKRGTVHFDKHLSDDFTLCIKHNGRFAALLGPLQSRSYDCFALIRHPLAVLGSWNSVDFQPYYGRLNAAEQFDRKLAGRLDAIEDRIERQLYLLDWFYRQFHQHLPPSKIIRYEDVVATQGKALRGISPVADQLDEPLRSKNTNTFYDRDVIAQLAERIEASDASYWQFYPRDELSKMVTQMLEQSA